MNFSESESVTEPGAHWLATKSPRSSCIGLPSTEIISAIMPGFFYMVLGSNSSLHACLIYTLSSELSPQLLSLASLIAEFFIESKKPLTVFWNSLIHWLLLGPKRCQSGVQVAFSLWFFSAWAPEMSEWGSNSFLTLFGFSQLLTVSSLNVALFFPLPLSVAAEIRIQLLSEPPLTEFRFLDMGLSPCPFSLSINPSDGRDPRG